MKLDDFSLTVRNRPLWAVRLLSFFESKTTVVHNKRGWNREWMPVIIFFLRFKSVMRVTQNSVQFQNLFPHFKKLTNIIQNLTTVLEFSPHIYFIAFISFRFRYPVQAWNGKSVSVWCTAHVAFEIVKVDVTPSI